jgi:hypothetical protein
LKGEEKRRATFVNLLIFNYFDSVFNEEKSLLSKAFRVFSVDQDPSIAPRACVESPRRFRVCFRVSAPAGSLRKFWSPPSEKQRSLHCTMDRDRIAFVIVKRFVFCVVWDCAGARS